MVAKDPSLETKDTSSESPAPEVLKPQAETDVTPVESTFSKNIPSKRPRRGSYRPSHKATFIGMAVIAAILAINGGVIYFVLRGHDPAAAQVNRDEVTLSSAALDKLGVSRNAIGNQGTELTVGPNSRFNGKVTIGGDVSIGGQLKLNGTFSAAEGNFAKLQAGDTSLNQLNVNGDATVSTLNLRKDLNVVGLTRLQGPVTISQILTVNNNLNVSGNLAVGGLLSARGFQASSLVSDTTLVIGGHIITRGSAPGVGPGNALGSNGTVSISGNDASGTVAANIGTGAGGGIIAQVAFRMPYTNTPHVVVTAVGGGIGSIYITRTAGGFSIGVNGPLSPGGYAFDYIVMQ